MPNSSLNGLMIGSRNAVGDGWFWELCSDVDWGVLVVVTQF